MLHITNLYGPSIVYNGVNKSFIYITVANFLNYHTLLLTTILCELSLIYLVVAREVRVKNSKKNLDDLVWNYSIASTN